MLLGVHMNSSELLSELKGGSEPGAFRVIRQTIWMSLLLRRVRGSEHDLLFIR